MGPAFDDGAGRLACALQLGGGAEREHEAGLGVAGHRHRRLGYALAGQEARLGERACAFVVARGAAPKAAELKAWIRDRGLAAFKVPDQIGFVKTFPITSVGKTSRKDLRVALQQQWHASRPGVGEGVIS